MLPETSALPVENTRASSPSVTSQLPIALLGASGYGALHLKWLLELQEKGLVKLAAIADPAIFRLPELRATLTERQIPWYEEPEELFKQEREIKAVSIAAPIPWHDKLCRAALKRNLHVFLEKPPVPVMQQWTSLLQLDAGQKIAVAFQNIASQPIQTLKRWRVEGRLGKIKTIRVAAGWRRDTKYYERSNWAGKLLLGTAPVFDGPATNALAHLLHDAMFLASPEPAGFAVPLEVTGEVYRARPIETYDTCCLRATLENEIELTIALTHACEENLPYQISVTGSEGKAWIGVDGAVLHNDRGWPQIHEPERLASRRGCYEKFILYAQGQCPRPNTFLADTRGYMLLTHGMILSSGRIHPVNAPFVSVVGSGQQTTYAIDGILPLIRTTLETGRLFSEQGVPWAVGGQNFSVRNITQLSLEPYLPVPA